MRVQTEEKSKYIFGGFFVVILQIFLFLFVSFYIFPITLIKNMGSK